MSRSVKLDTETLRERQSRAQECLAPEQDLHDHRDGATCHTCSTYNRD